MTTKNVSNIIITEMTDFLLYMVGLKKHENKLK